MQRSHPERRHSSSTPLSLLLLLPALLAVLPPGAARAASIPLNVDEPMGVARKDFPIRVGVPFARGELRAAEGVVLGPNGQPVPCQVQKWTDWSDGSIRMLMVDFLADVPAGGKATYRLETGKPSKLAKPVQVQEAGGKVTVDTGAIKFTVDGAGIQQVSVGGQSIQKGSRLLVAVGSQALTASGGKVTVEERGPLVAMLKCEGKHGNRFPYVVRVMAWAGCSYVRVYHTLVFDGEPEKERVGSFGIKFDLDLQGGKTYGVGGGITRTDQWGGLALDRGAPSSYGGARGEITVHQSSWNKYSISGGASQSGQHHQGWIDLSDSRGGLTAGIRDGWRLYEKGLKADPNDGSVSVYLWPPMAQPLDLRRHSDILNENEPKIRGKPDPGAEESIGTAQGIGITHELLLYYHAGSAQQAGSEAVAAAFSRPSIAYATPEVYANSLVFGEFAPYSEKFASQEEFFRRIMLWWYWGQQNDPNGWHYEGKQMKVASRGPWYGLVDFGDVQCEYHDPARPKGGWQYTNGRYSWICGEPDVGHAFFLHYIRTGERIYYDLAEAFVRHEMDIDNNHMLEDQDRFGGGRRHNVSHWGEESAFYGCSHTWVQGWLDYYQLSGYRRALDKARDGADFGWHVITQGKRKVDKAGRLGNERETVLWDREFCLPMKNNVLLWTVTHEAKYRSRIDELIPCYTDFQQSDGCWPARFDFVGKSGSSPDKRVYSTSRSSFKSSPGGFSVYYVNPPFIHYWLDTGDEKAKNGVIKHANFLMSKIAVHPEYAAEAIGFAYLRTGDAKYLSTGTKIMQQGMSCGGGRFSLGKFNESGLFNALGGNSGPHRASNGRLRSLSRYMQGGPLMLKAMSK